MNAINEFKRLSGCYFIDNEIKSSASPTRYDVIDPATEVVLGQFADCAESEIADVIASTNKHSGYGVPRPDWCAPNLCTIWRRKYVRCLWSMQK